MPDAASQIRLKRPCSEFLSLPADARTSLVLEVDKTNEPHSRISRNCAGASDIVSDWRLAFLYLAFDWELTMRGAIRHDIRVCVPKMSSARKRTCRVAAWRWWAPPRMGVYEARRVFLPSRPPKAGASRALRTSAAPAVRTT